MRYADTPKWTIDELVRCGQRLLNPHVTQVLFYVACGIWLVFCVLNTSFVSAFLQRTIVSESFVAYYVVLMVALCEVGVLLRRGYQSRDAYALLALLPMLAGPLRLGFQTLSVSMLLVFCARSFDVRKTIAICSAIVCCTFLVVVVAAGAGGIWDYVMGNANKGGRVRHCLGFLYPLFPAQYVFCLTCSVCYLRGKNLSAVEGALLLCINAFMYVLSRSRLSFVTGCALVVFTFLLHIPWVERRSWPRLRKVLVWSFPLALLVSLFITLLYGLAMPLKIDFFEGMNVTFGGRLKLGFNGLLNFGFTALGQPIPWQGNGLNAFGYNSNSMAYNYVDNMFIHILMEEGWLYTLGLMVLLTLLAHRAWKTGNDALLLVLAATAIHCVVDDLSMYLHYNVMFFALASLYSYGTESNPPRIPQFRLVR